MTERCGYESPVCGVCGFSHEGEERTCHRCGEKTCGECVETCCNCQRDTCLNCLEEQDCTCLVLFPRALYLKMLERAERIYNDLPPTREKYGYTVNDVLETTLRLVPENEREILFEGADDREVIETMVEIMSVVLVARHTCIGGERV